MIEKAMQELVEHIKKATYKVDADISVDPSTDRTILEGFNMVANALERGLGDIAEAIEKSD